MNYDFLDKYFGKVCMVNDCWVVVEEGIYDIGNSEERELAISETIKLERFLEVWEMDLNMKKLKRYRTSKRMKLKLH